MFTRAASYPLNWLCAIEQREQDIHPGVADEAVSVADGAGGGQYAGKLAKVNSRCWRDGARETEKASARGYRALAWYKM
jgi:hypothetical protein